MKFSKHFWQKEKCAKKSLRNGKKGDAEKVLLPSDRWLEMCSVCIAYYDISIMVQCQYR